ncbi:hypothetical protein YC2023_080722 [Brassica napus]
MHSSPLPRVFTIVNSCDQTIWPAITPGENFSGGGFKLKPGHSIVFKAPVDWSGRIWGRTGCKFDKTGTGSCETGSCGSNLKCSTSGKQPASLAEFTLSSVDFYDVSLVDGFNLPMTVNPVNGTGNCTVAGCVADLTLRCPAELAVKSKGRVISCRSACDVFDTDEYCCRGVYGNPSTCRPTHYSKIFKKACPTAYSYAYDDPTRRSRWERNMITSKYAAMVLVSGGFKTMGVIFSVSEEWAANTEFESHSTVSLQSTTELEAPAVSSSHDVTAKPTLPDELLTSVSSQPQKPDKQEKVASSKGTSGPRKRNYDPDLFFKVNGKLYHRLGKIGSGGSSEVHKVISSDCTIYALKKIKLKGRDYATAYGFCQEIGYLKKLKGKTNIIQLIDYEVTDKCLLQEVMNGTMSSKDARVKDDGFIYMVLEYGEIDLARMLSQKWKEIEGSDGTIDENWLSLGP